MDAWSIVVPGRVVPLARGRHSNGRVHNERRSLEYQSRLAIAMRIKMTTEKVPHTAAPFTKDDRGRVFPADQLVHVSLRFMGPDLRKGDGDNMQKSVWDAITKAGVWWDDKQVDSWDGKKLLGKEEGTLIRITPVINILDLTNNAKDW